MNLKHIVSLLSLFGFVLGCGGKANINTDDVNGVNANEAIFAVFQEKLQVADIDLDGQDDDSVSSLVIMMSDNPEICEIMSNDPDLTNPGDLVISFGIAVKVEIDNTEGFLPDGNDDRIFTGNEILLDTGFTVFQENIVIADTAGEGFGTLLVKNNVLDKKFVGALSDTLTLEFADIDNFDTDLDADGTNDAKSINAAFEVEFNADFCESLVQ